MEGLDELLEYLKYPRTFEMMKEYFAGRICDKGLYSKLRFLESDKQIKREIKKDKIWFTKI
jgi:hypothetical protein